MFLASKGRSIRAFAIWAIISLSNSGFLIAQPSGQSNAFSRDSTFSSVSEIEPTVRIGLATNARSVSITTSDSTLVSFSLAEQPKLLSTAKVTVSPRAYRPPMIENYRFEIRDIATRDEAEQLASEISEITGEKTSVSSALTGETFAVRIGDFKETIEEANAFKEFLGEKGFEEAEIITEKFAQPSAEALALSDQLRKKSNTEVRSLTLPRPPNTNQKPVLIKTTGTSAPVVDSPDSALDPNLKEILVNGGNANAKFSTFKPIAFASSNERNVPVKVNGKAYRGKIEVFVNSRGTLSVVNVASLEDYLRGVVPNELSLPELEAQKAQAVAARTYAWANLGTFSSQGFDLLPTTRSQVYRGFSSESAMGIQAVNETRGIVATYNGKPINAMYTSTCGGRTENSENIFEFNEPYLRGVECSLEGHSQFEPSMVKTSRENSSIKDESNLDLLRKTIVLSTGGFPIPTNRLSDDWLESSPSETEVRSWFAPVSARLRPPLPSMNIPRPVVIVTNTLQPNATANKTPSPTPTPVPTPIPTPLPIAPLDARPGSIANFLAAYLFVPQYADTMLSAAEINYQLSFRDGDDVPQSVRANTAAIIRDGWISLYPDATLRPNQQFSRGRLIQVIYRLAQKKSWLPNLQNGTARNFVDGKLTVRNGKTEKQILVRPDVFLFRQFGEALYPVREAAILGGESVNYQINPLGEIIYLEIKPTANAASADRFSSLSNWNVSLSPSAVQSRLSRFVKGIGTLVDLNVKTRGSSRRATEIELFGTNGKFSLKGGVIRSALRLKEQLFVVNKRFDSDGRIIAYTFSGRGWGHGVGMCQFGAFGLAKQGLKYDEILKHYYTGITLTKAY